MADAEVVCDRSLAVAVGLRTHDRVARAVGEQAREERARSGLPKAALVQDRLTKAGIYAAAGIPEYWIVARRGDHVQVATNPMPLERRYGTERVARRGEHIALTTLPDVRVAVDDLLPPADSRDA